VKKSGFIGDFRQISQIVRRDKLSGFLGCPRIADTRPGNGKVAPEIGILR
jgi:hypothetical protein